MINRRRLLWNVAGAATATLVPYGVYRHWRGEPATITLDKVGMALGHELRDHPPTTRPEIELHCDTLILGSGAAALTAAWKLCKEGQRSITLIEGPEPNGNMAGAYDGELAYPTGAHYLAQPSMESVHVRELLANLGILQSGADQPYPVYDDLLQLHAPEERLWYQQRWHYDLLPQQDADSTRFFQFIRELALKKGADGKRLFVIPVVQSSQDAQWLALDQLSFKDWLDQQGYHSTTLLWYLNYCCRDEYGLGLERISAWSGLHYFAARLPANGSEDKDNEGMEGYLVWPDGLAGLAKRMRAHIGLQATALTTYQPGDIPQAISAFATKVIERDTHVEVWVRQAATAGSDRQERCFIARQVICAMPLYIAAHVVQDMPRYGFNPQQHLPTYASWLVSNFTLKRYPPEFDQQPLAWDNVVYNGQGLGYVVATHQWIRVAKPERTVFTAYTTFDFAKPAAVRYWLRDASEQNLMPYALADLQQVYGSRFMQHVASVKLTLRGHAMASPVVNHLQNEGIKALQQHQSRLLFAHSDLSGYSVFEEAAWWGWRAAGVVLQGA